MPKGVRAAAKEKGVGRLRNDSKTGKINIMSKSKSGSNWGRTGWQAVTETVNRKLARDAQKNMGIAKTAKAKGTGKPLTNTLTSVRQRGGTRWERDLAPKSKKDKQVIGRHANAKPGDVVPLPMGHKPKTYNNPYNTQAFGSMSHGGKRVLPADFSYFDAMEERGQDPGVEPESIVDNYPRLRTHSGLTYN
jgi:hypothetical protein